MRHDHMRLKCVARLDMVQVAPLVLVQVALVLVEAAAVVLLAHRDRPAQTGYNLAPTERTMDQPRRSWQLHQ